MTEKTAENIKGWLWGLNLTLLGFIATGVGWLIFNISADVKANREDIKSQKDEIRDQQIITYNLAKVIEQVQENQKKMDTEIDYLNQEFNQNKKEYNAEFMEIWKSQKRNGQSVDMTKYTKE